ncbi:hypothetical protein BKA63DRAFT_218102 [Paraphoma chrysanthemicola]|nr:hypothetical protein BKA63DRAFT_218102 [Paraphoma chrysanthemicola]
MKHKALDAITSQTIRPGALEAATDPDKTEGKQQATGMTPRSKTHDAGPDAPTKRSAPFGQRTNDTKSATKLVEEVVHGVKAAVDGAIFWVEKKADELSSHSDSTGPYASPANCASSDLDAIATGASPAMSTTKQNDDRDRRDKADMTGERGPDRPGDKFSQH